jgi:hypothetical protein
MKPVKFDKGTDNDNGPWWVWMLAGLVLCSIIWNAMKCGG